MEGKNRTSSFGLLMISALELEDSEQEIIPHEIVWSGDSTTSQTPATAHQHFGCETFTTVSSVTVYVSCLHGCTGDML